MTYPPGTSGYPPAQQPPGSYGSSTASFAKTEDAESKLPLYLAVATAVLGLAAYLATFGPIHVSEDGDFSSSGAGQGIGVAVVAALLAAVGLLPKAKNYTPIVAVIAVGGALLTISEALTPGEHFATGWGLWLALGFTVLQAVAAVVALLLEAGVVTAPAPKPKYDQYAQYGLPQGGGYYGQQAPGQQQSGYPSYGSYPSGPSTGGFSAQGPSTGGFATGAQPTQQVQQQQGQQHQGPPTPPTGFPSFGQPPSGGQGGPNSGHGQQQQHGQQHGQQQHGQGQQAPSGPQQQ
ncbi:DUF5336 domain-containing protein [Mycobacterium sp. pUA109]|uniref:DUF5336 domain-containing protein n=1 Tax=Mycobacterium sp. pUA109 TaxID=3238982 RepID=UPI00351B0B90